MDMIKWKRRIRRQGKICYAGFLWGLEKTLGIDGAKKMDALLRFGRKLNLAEPQTLADKVSWISLHALSDTAVRCTDKWEARSYVASKGLEEILVPVYGGPVSSVDALDFAAFPNRFVLKATHGSAMNYFCRDKAALDERDCRTQVKRWLKTTYGTFSAEPHYRKLPHRVYCEAYLEENLMDYKIHCLNGKPSFILVCSRREGRHVQRDLFDPQWNRLQGLQSFRGHVPGTGQIKKPENLAQMLRIAEILSRDFAFVRVDLYNTEGRIFFGELTFTPVNGVFAGYSQEFLEEEGKKLRITNLEPVK